MSHLNTRRVSISTPKPPTRSFGMNDAPLDDQNNDDITPMRRALGRLSFGGSRTNLFSRTRTIEDDTTSIATDKPPIPAVISSATDPQSTPLPILSMVVLSIALLGEFLCANVSTPFLLFMVKSFGKLVDDAEVAFWTGILVATFFLTQFLTSLLWATIAEKHGRRSVLVVSLLGSTVTCIAFGSSTTLEQAIAIRLLQGIFGGAVGVARGSVAFVTDPSNEGRAYAILGFCWGMGGVAGAIIGGSFERPAEKWPEAFGHLWLFTKYPYLLPCAVAASVTLIGSILACFLGPDGGPREGAIRLMPEKANMSPVLEEDELSMPPSPVFEDHPLPMGIHKKVSQKLSGYFRRNNDGSPSPRPETPQPPVPLASSGIPISRTFSRTSRGSAYGYGATPNLKGRIFSGRGGPESVASSYRRRRLTNNEIRASRSGADASDMGFAQKLLMANENAVTNIADLWVAAAMNVDNEEVFEDSDTDMAYEDEEALLLDDEDAVESDDDSIYPGRGRSGDRPVIPTHLHPTSSGSPIPFHLRPSSSRPSNASGTPVNRAQLVSPHRPSFSRPLNIRRNSPRDPFDVVHGTPTSRRFSMKEPGIFAHAGVRTPPAVLDAQQLLNLGTPPADGLEPIFESRPVSMDMDRAAATEPSLIGQIPILIIVQYGLLALHTTTHDQVFMSYLVTDYSAGGLNLNPGHFAQLIALMCLAQIAYQFYLYPNIGPPRGRFSHLAMFRIGSLLFVPSYMVVVMFRPLATANDDGNAIVMAALAICTAVRYCGSTFGYTSISILLNYMTPPAAVGYANGIAQSMVSLARCFGPVIGGWLWSASIANGPAGYWIGFFICAGVCVLSVLQSFAIR